MKFKDFGWDDIILEAPNETETGDELSATDYDDADNLEVEEVPDEELKAEDYDEELNTDGEENPEDTDIGYAFIDANDKELKHIQSVYDGTR